MQRAGFLHHPADPYACPDCGATFTPGNGGLELTRCEPDNVALIRAISEAPACSYCHPCLLGATFPKRQWEKLAELDWPLNDFSTIRSPEPLFITHHPPLPAGIELQDGEEIALDVGPVYIGEEIWGLESSPSRAIVTNRRLLIAGSNTIYPVPFESIVAVEESHPGLRIQRDTGLEPIYLFTPILSDALSRIKLLLSHG